METTARKENLSTEQRRKRLGQFFTGGPASRLLAALATFEECVAVLDPMVGTGAMLIAAANRNGEITELGGMEIDPEVYESCVTRFGEIGLSTSGLALGSAFSAETVRRLPMQSWDSVITNPPYVRYQSAGQSVSSDVMVPSAEQVRSDLHEAIAACCALDDVDLRYFRELIRGYSGLADLAVPSWILCAGLVKVGGVLAILVPSTWLSRNYALPIRYLIERWFDVKYVVEDGDASWFDDALVRTTLVVATRVPRRQSAFEAGPEEGHVRVRLTAEMASNESLVGGLFGEHCGDPDLEFSLLLSEWKAAAKVPEEHPLHPRWNSASEERRALKVAVSESRWVLGMEEHSAGARVASHVASSELSSAAEAVDTEFVRLRDLGWRVGQGLRTGANMYFYLEVEEDARNWECLRASVSLNERSLEVPTDLSAAVVRRQSDLPGGFVINSDELTNRVLLLEGWGLPEDLEDLPAGLLQVLPEQLAELTRHAATVNVGSEAAPRRIPELSAVAPNVRTYDPRQPDRPARFWYQLPALTERHRPSLLVARVNGSSPRVYINEGRLAVVDANFSTLWAPADSPATQFALLAVLNSAWCKAEMELRGTVLGGGALKLEAAHLRELALPLLTENEWMRADKIGRELVRLPPHRSPSHLLSQVDNLLLTAAGTDDPKSAVIRVAALVARKIDQRSK